MNRILFFLKQLVAGPINMIAGPLGLTNSAFDQSPRNRAMMLGLPAVVVAILGLSLFVWASYGSQDRLEKRYELQVKSYMEKLEDLAKKSSSISDPKSSDAEKLRDEFEETRVAAQVYLKKLITIDPENNEYRFKLATTTFMGRTEQEKARGLELMQAIAPDDEPGYSKAHLWLAGVYESQIVDRKTGRANRKFADLVLKHLGHCLARDANNVTAMFKRAGMLRAMGRLNESYKLYEQLFEKNPYRYKDLYDIDQIRLQRGIDRTEIEKQDNGVRRKIVLETAQKQFKERIAKIDENESKGQWVADWEALVRVMVLRRKFEEVEKALKDEFEMEAAKVNATPTPLNASRTRILNNLLVGVYNSWAADFASEKENGSRIRTLQIEEMDEASIREQLEKLKLGLDLAPNNPDILNRIASISLSDSPVAAAARESYDPRLDPDPPAAVLAQLGNRSLLQEDYDKAIQYFSQARDKSKQDPTILNNLAYAHLVAETPNPDLSLSLIRDAISKLPRIPNVRLREIYRSNFFDTQGHALLQLNDPQGAVECFLVALKQRPDEPKILDAIVQAYEAAGNKIQADVYRKRMAEIQDKKKGKVTSRGNSEGP